MRLSRELVIIYVAAFIRSVGVGLLGVIAGVYLFRIGLTSSQIGWVLSGGLAGVTTGTAIVGFCADRFGRRRAMILLAVLSCVGGVALGTVRSLGPLVALVFIGMLNGMGTDRSATYALEQAIIPGLVADRSRTMALSWYNVLLDGGGAVGAFAAGMPLVLQSWLRVELTVAYKDVLFGYAGLQLLTAALYAQLTPTIEIPRAPDTTRAEQISRETKSVVRRLAALFWLDSFGGGFLGDALVSYWFFRRFGLDEKQLGALFLGIHLLNAASHLGAAWLSRRIGLVNTMVFTHLPSSLFVIAVPFAPGAKSAIVLLLMREALADMDVPTRQSYVAAVVQPHERTYASGITNLTRNFAWATANSVAGIVMQNLAFSAPLVLGGVCKITYDLLLYRGFRHLRPPEEQALTATPKE